VFLKIVAQSELLKTESTTLDLEGDGLKLVAQRGDIEIVFSVRDEDQGLRSSLRDL
jgi:hypothetical protein